MKHDYDLWYANGILVCIVLWLAVVIVADIVVGFAAGVGIIAANARTARRQITTFIYEAKRRASV